MQFVESWTHCSKKGYVNIICESYGLEAVDLIINGRDHTMHTYATDILRIRNDLHGNEYNIDACLGNKICA